MSVYIGRGNHVLAWNGAFYVYCRPEEVSEEMNKILKLADAFFRWQSSDVTVFIQWLHHRFVNIHPSRVRFLSRSNTLTYQDGNGGVTRAIVSAILWSLFKIRIIISEHL